MYLILLGILSWILYRKEILYIRLLNIFKTVKNMLYSCKKFAPEKL